MNKENSRSAAGLRRSAIAERIRLRQDWLALKEVDDNPVEKQGQRNVSTKKQTNPSKYRHNTKQISKTRFIAADKENYKFAEPHTFTNEVLNGAVVLVDVGAETKALPLRAALTALGATVVSSWSPLVTHVVWTQGGCRDVRAKARVLACHLVSPLWVEACATSGRRLPEKVFPAPTRPSDLPSPATLKRLLKKAEFENIALSDLLSDSQDSDKEKQPRLRISSDNDTTNSTDTSHDTSNEKSTDKRKSTDKSHNSSRDTPSESVRVNTAPRRAGPISVSPERPMKSKRKLFTQREAELNETENESDNERTPVNPKKNPVKMTPRNRRQLATAERMARRMLGTASASKQANKHTSSHTDKPNIVLTGMTGKERHNVCNAIRSLNGHIQNHVNRKTTHVLLGSCLETPNANCVTISMKQCKCPERTMTQMFSEQPELQAPVICPCQTQGQNLQRNDHIDQASSQKSNQNVNMSKDKDQRFNGINVPNDLISQIVHMSQTQEQNGQLFDLNGEINQNLEQNAPNIQHLGVADNDRNEDGSEDIVIYRVPIPVDKPRTVNALLGAARGCRVLYAKWAIDCMKAKKWLHHIGYEVSHLMKICQKARVERAALGLLHCEYAYNIFRGMHVYVTPNAEQKDAVLQLLTLCGAIVQNGGHRSGQNRNVLFKIGKTKRGLTQNGDVTQNGGFDIKIGVLSGEVCSKWVFDSVAASRMRTTRRYINKNVPDD